MSNSASAIRREGDGHPHSKYPAAPESFRASGTRRRGIAVRRVPAIMGRVLVGFKTLRFAPPPRRGAEGLDADSALAFGAAIGDRPHVRLRLDESEDGGKF